jgi:hypothetical protein
VLNALTPPFFTAALNGTLGVTEGQNITFRYAAADGAQDTFRFRFAATPPLGATLSPLGLLTWQVPLDASQFGTPPDGRAFDVFSDAWGNHTLAVLATAVRSDAVRLDCAASACACMRAMRALTRGCAAPRGRTCLCWR